MTKQTFVTRESLDAMLHNSNPEYVQKVIGRALAALLERQTLDEQASNATVENNTIGFAGCDGRSGTLTAKYWLKHRRLEDWMVERWTRIGKSGFPRLCKYAKQLNEIAASKAVNKGVTV
jgi:hypothetical protein